MQISWLLQKPTDLDMHCLPLSMWIYSNNLHQDWLKIRCGHGIDLFSRTRVKRLDTLHRFSAIFLTREATLWFPICFPVHHPLWKKNNPKAKNLVLRGRKEFFPKGSKFFTFRVHPFTEGSKNNFYTVVSLENASVLLKCRLMRALVTLAFCIKIINFFLWHFLICQIEKRRYWLYPTFY